VETAYGSLRPVFESSTELAKEYRKVQEAEERQRILFEQVAYAKMSVTGKNHQQALNSTLVAHKRLTKDRIANATSIFKRERERQVQEIIYPHFVLTRSLRLGFGERVITWSTKSKTITRPFIALSSASQ